MGRDQLKRKGKGRWSFRILTRWDALIREILKERRVRDRFS